MLQQVCEHIHNFFVHDKIRGKFEIAGGMIPIQLLNGQRFRIKGSVMSDGVYTYHDNEIHDDDDCSVVGLQDETFAGTIYAMAVPPAVIALSEEIGKWVEKYGEANDNPYMSESVQGVYSYTKAGYGSGAGGQITWQDVFRNRLNAWRKVCDELD